MNESRVLIINIFQTYNFRQIVNMKHYFIVLFLPLLNRNSIQYIIFTMFSTFHDNLLLFILTIYF